MHFETDAGQFIEAKVRGKIQSRGEFEGDIIKHAMDIPLTAKLPAAYILPRLAIQEDDLKPDLMFHRKDGSVRTLSIEDVKVDREYKDYRMTISFSSLDPKKGSETFPCSRIHVTKISPVAGGMMDVDFTVQLHPFEEEDVGRLSKQGIEFGMKACFLQFEQLQKDLANAA